jgi:hypothetical protein
VIPGFAGPVLGPDDAGYDEARAVWNIMHDRRPVAVARCLSPADVAAAIAYARAEGLAIAVRCSDTVLPDLFWALRGGGGNFGVVTEFEFSAHELSVLPILATFHPLERAREVLRLGERMMRDLGTPDALLWTSWPTFRTWRSSRSPTSCWPREPCTPTSRRASRCR